MQTKNLEPEIANVSCKRRRYQLQAEATSGSPYEKYVPIVKAFKHVMMT